MRQLFFESYVPKQGLPVFVTLFVLVLPLNDFLVLKFLGRSEPIAITAMYRQGGDIAYYEIIAALARGNWGESNIYEGRHQNIQGFPFGSVLLHALCFSIFGAVGLWIADMIVTYVFFATLVFLFRILGAGRLFSAALAFAVCSYFLLDVVFWVEPLSRYAAYFTIWGNRFPRPFVSEAIFLVLFAANIALFINKKSLSTTYTFWILYGILNALLIQADIYWAFTFSIVEILALVYHCRSQEFRRTIVTKVWSGCLGFMLGITPFIIQQTHIHPDLPRRLGVFPIAEISKFMILTYTPQPLILLGLMGIGIIAITYFALSPGEARRKSEILAFIGLLCIAGLLSLMLFTVMTRKGIQVYHFRINMVKYYSYAFLIFFVMGVNTLKELSTRMRKSIQFPQYLRESLVILWCVACFAASQSQSFFSAEHQGHARNDFYSFATDYRDDFRRLVAELEKIPDNAPAVLGTLDHQVHAYWQTFHRNGYSFLPDVFVSTVPDQEAEYRLMDFARVMNLTPEGLLHLVQIPYNAFFWLGHAKFQASQAYTFAPLSAYTAQQRTLIENTSIWHNWQFIIPQTELARLKTAYQHLKLADTLKLDYIVLTQLEPFEPHRGTFQLIYANDTFRLWKRME